MALMRGAVVAAVFCAVGAVCGADWQVFDMGFPGDKVQNVMWRVLQGTLAGYDPARIVISVVRREDGRKWKSNWRHSGRRSGLSAIS